MWDSLALLLCAAAFGSHAGVVTNTQPTWSPDGRWIAYASDRDGRFDIWKTDGTHVRRVARGGSDPAWSPSGKKIAFVARGMSVVSGIYTTDASGTSAVRRRLTAYGFEPAWSPDGRRIAFAAPTGGCDRGVGIWVMRSDGSGKVLVAESPDEFTDYVEPAWSPDGKRIAYAIPNSDQGESGIVTVTVSAIGEAATPQLVIDQGSQPAWSPDGREIVYVSSSRKGSSGLHIVDVHTFRDRQLTAMPASVPAWSPGGKRIAFSVRATDGSYDLYLINPDGSHLVRLTRPIRSSGPPGTASDFSDVTNGSPAWSPDGRWIAFVAGRRVPTVAPSAAVTVIGVDGRERQTLTLGVSPTWSPDGQRLAFVEEHETGAYIDLIDADGANRRRLVQTQTRDPRPDWSPDGTRIAYDEVENNVAGIYVVNVETGVRSLLISDGFAPDWSQDGSRIMFMSHDNALNRYYLEVADSDGTNRRRIVTGSTPWEGLRWSPDDQHIAYTGGPGYAGIHVMNADGSDAHRITDGYAPSWSPDGSSIAFGGGYEVMTIPSSGGVPTRITYGGCTIVGTDGPDKLLGTPKDDVICAFGGSDTISGGPGDDRILGGNGGDRILGGSGRDRIFSEDGADSIDSGPGRDSIWTGKGPDVIIADDGEADYLDGEEGIDCATADSHDHLVEIEHRGCPRTETNRSPHP